MSDFNPKSVPKLELPPTEPDRDQKDVSPSRRSRLSTNLESTSVRTSNSNSNSSPTRSTSTHTPLSTTPSVAAVQRAISASKTNHVSLDGVTEANKDRLQRSGQNTPSWPTSPRLKSPPPSTVRSMLPRRADAEHTQSNTSLKRLASAPIPELASAMQLQQESDREQQGQGSLRPVGRAVGLHGHGLETVAESSLPTTPSFGPTQPPPHGSINEVPPLEETTEASADSSNSKTDASVSTDNSNKSNQAKLDATSITAPLSRATSSSRPETTLAKRSFTSLSGTKPKSTIEPLRTMTIETETVNSTPQLIGDRGREAGGSIRTRTSNETIRPKKEKKKPTRKAPSLHAGTATSKADIFEAKVASAVDEADSSDSDETFVYESNPPEPRQNRHHSRTPSATSIASQVDYYGARSKHGVRSGSNAIPGKRSMKFSSSLYGGQIDVEGSGGDGGRSSTRTHSSTPRPHHIGRYGRNGHASIIDGDSPFAQANRIGSPRTPTMTNLRYSRPNSPRLSNGRLASGRKNAAGGYDTYDDGADDERAPLIGSVRVNRSRHSRRSNGQFRSMDYDEEEPGCWARFGGCILLGLLVVLVCLGVSTFVMALNRPLMDVEVRHLQNVLASEQELMLDLHVTAMNPNLFAITVNELDIMLFAESPYAGTSREWEEHHLLLESTWMKRRKEYISRAEKRSFWFPPFHQDDGVDEGTDPIEEEPGIKNMLLGHIFYFDSPLMFDASPIRHNPTSSVGEVRLTQPGNQTEIGGSARWERVLKHPFDLIVRGIIKYQLPLSSRTRSAKIEGRVRVSPDADEGDNGKRNTTSVIR